ncbi:hypothetical protein [Microvirga massiliensis]|uniref:hypothetical protein n=1 Tax=Microvirga massiliensis TaxID=1033741 RepID=UPI00062B8E1F|nr:hypothetical protein [Microvirga massiliensis]
MNCPNTTVAVSVAAVLFALVVASLPASAHSFSESGTKGTAPIAQPAVSSRQGLHSAAYSARPEIRVRQLRTYTWVEVEATRMLERMR